MTFKSSEVRRFYEFDEEEIIELLKLHPSQVIVHAEFSTPRGVLRIWTSHPLHSEIRKESDSR